MDLSGVNSLSDPGFIFCAGKSIRQPDKFCIRNNVLFHEANVFPVEISDHCMLFSFYIWMALLRLEGRVLHVKSFLS